MPKPETIKAKLLELPILDVYDRPRGKNLWEANEHGGHFHFFGCCGFLWDPTTGDHIDAIGYKLFISGSEKNKAAIAADFIEVLGPPRVDVRQEIRKVFSRIRRKPIDRLTWFQPEDEKVPNTSSLRILAENFVEVTLLDSVPKNSPGPSVLGNATKLLPRFPAFPQPKEQIKIFPIPGIYI